MSGNHIVCVDDQEIILLSLRQELARASALTDAQIELVNSGEKALRLIESILADGEEIPVIISDQRMPGMNGDEFLDRAHSKIPESKNILLTGYTDIEAVTRLVNHEALYRYIAKPWASQDLILTIGEAYKSFFLKKQIAELSRQNEKLTNAMVAALESANFIFDEDTGRHIQRIADISMMIAKGADLEDLEVRKIHLYASLHDIGKIGVPHEILTKPGPLDPSEFDLIKQHVRIGYKILDKDDIDPMAKNITLYHHERWDGSGYIHGLAGKEIPIEARIVGIADAFDALVNARVYKPAFTLEKAVSIIRDGAGAQFDPEIVQAFLATVPMAFNQLQHPKSN
jgi:response regulator RpfG family c-di-GMP phosphodiesterase